MIQANVVSNRLGRWKRGFVCSHILLAISRADFGWATATRPVSWMSIRTRSTCTVAIRCCLTAYKPELTYFASYPRHYFPSLLKTLWSRPLRWRKRTGYSPAPLPVLTAYTCLNTSTACSCLPLESKNLGDSGRKRRNAVAAMLVKALTTTNTLHELNVIGIHESSTAQSWGITSHARPEKEGTVSGQWNMFLQYVTTSYRI